MRQVPPRRRLRFRVATGVALGLLTLLLVFAVLMAWAIRISTEAVQHERLVMARTTARAVDDLLGQALHQLEALAGEVQLEESGDRPRAEQPGLARLVHVSGTYEAMGVLDPQGAMVWSWGPAEDVGALRVSRAWKTALEIGRPGLSPAELAAAHPPIALAAAPLRGPRGALAGALAGTLHFAHMGVELVPLPQDGADLYVEIVDHAGRVLRSSGSSDAATTAAGHLELLASFLQSGVEGAQVHEPPGGQAHLVVYAPFQRLPGGVFVEEREDVALLVPRQLQRIGVFVGSTAMVLVSLGAWWYARHITRPLEELTEAARTMAAGSFDPPVQRPASQDELGVLARSFEEMRARLREAFQDRLRWEEDLERQVRERTEAVRRLLEEIITAQEEERKRIGRELHDGAAQDLATLVVALETLEADAALPQGRRDLVQRVKAQARMALQEVRRLLLDLRPSGLDELGLVPAVRWYVETRLASSGIEHAVTALGQERRLSPALETTLFRIVQEAVNNAARHAQPRRIAVTLDFTGPAMVATVEDDGRGFDPAIERGGASGQALGLMGMRERAALAGGSLAIHSQPGQGTRVEARIPTGEDIRAPH
ncbi:MAG: HAMP domain-containing protein [Chloroflexi bacterium]|nr:HAMP domain-containing protein [Chloroflexota bacterium]